MLAAVTSLLSTVTVTGIQCVFHTTKSSHPPVLSLYPTHELFSCVPSGNVHAFIFVSLSELRISKKQIIKASVKYVIPFFLLIL